MGVPGGYWGLCPHPTPADVAESVDALVSGTSGSNAMGVQVSPSALYFPSFNSGVGMVWSPPDGDKSHVMQAAWWRILISEEIARSLEGGQEVNYQELVRNECE